MGNWVHLDLSLLIQSGSPPPPQKPTEREKCGRGDDGELGPPGPQSLHPEWLHLPLPRSPQSGRSADEETMGNWVHLDLSLLIQSGSPPPPQKPTEREKCGRGDDGELGPPGPQSLHPEWLHLPLPRSPQSGRSADEETLGNWVHLDLSLLIQSGSPPPPQKPTEREKCGRGDDGELGPPGPQSLHPEWLHLPLPRSPQSGRSADEETLGNWVHLDLSLFTQSGSTSLSPEARRAGEVRTRRRWGTGSTWTSVSSPRVAPPPSPQKPTEREKCGRGDAGGLGLAGPQSPCAVWLPLPSPEARTAERYRRGRAGETRST
uniref:basic salivary proline-rich protein 1-like n=1 Tax=Callithrix jacchus TaxID=9483 RepID=UPI0023DD0A8F|nr:basic salivary proline-rich protein 1-like [Callithrix jacchus]